MKSGHRRSTVALALVGLTLGAGRLCASSPTLSVRLEAREPEPATRYRLEIEAEPEIAAVRVLVDDGEAGIDRRRPFRIDFELEEVGDPRWIEVAGLDAGGREVSWVASLVHAPADRAAIRARLLPTGEVVVFVSAGVGRSVERVELVTPEATLATAVRPVYRFELPAQPTGEPALPLAVRASFDDGTTVEDWSFRPGFGEQVEVRLGEARIHLPPGAPAPTPDSVAVTWRGRPQRVVRVVGGEDASLELGIVVDVSGSALDQLAEFRSAAATAAGRLLTATDRLWIGEFGARTRLLGSGRGDIDRLIGRLPAAARTEQTSIVSALRWALHQFHGEDTRAALVAVTDGCQTAGSSPFEALGEAALERAIPLFLIRTTDPCEARLRPDTGAALTWRQAHNAMQREFGLFRSRLDTTVDLSGGRVFLLGQETGFESALIAIRESLLRQWRVVFEPESEAVRSRDVEVRLAPG